MPNPEAGDTWTIEGVNVQGTVYLITHGNKYKGPNPQMTLNGIMQIKGLVSYLPDDPALVICGTGYRHEQTAMALKLTVNEFSSVVGRPESLEIVDGDKVVVLANGTKVPLEQYNTTGLAKAMCVLLNSLLTDTVICTGRPGLIYFGVPAESAAVYKLEGNCVTKVIAHGDIGAGKAEV